ncbi:LOW QUALITY PROTEIN: cytospin-A-like [Acanthaster planci]|uniref:LOW QUALITY PROTEIN: cytospin-A-like n=1 Tax=Acanthaster planci TaxID=133434 RepID=A0A8B7ZSB8_ACAPL|nr:LOW QUALITY PROTEIN: cytospin-A-like [Acanthaster planci]
MKGKFVWSNEAVLSAIMSQAAGKSDSAAGWSEIQDLLQQTQLENTSMRQQLDMLRQENRLLKDRIKTHELEALDSKTDNEKAMLLRLEGSVTSDDRSHHAEEDLDETAGSFVIADSNGDQILPGFPSSSSEGSAVPEEVPNMSESNWEILSSEGEGSVACLQDRIHQMEENHYTVNEELQATLQELTDLQDNVNELNYENEKLTEEKSVIIEALYRQLEKVECLKNYLESLKGRLEESCVDIELDDLDETFNTAFTDISLQSLDLTEVWGSMSQGTGDRKRLSEILSEHRKETQSEITKLKEKMNDMERSLDNTLVEMEQQSQELTVAKGKLASTEVELERTQVMMEEERSRLTALLHNQDPEGKLNLVNLMDQAKQEKEALEQRCAILQRALQESQQHAAKQQQEIEESDQDFEAAREHVEREVKQMNERIQEVEGEKHELETEVINLKETILELEEARERHEADKVKHLTTIADLNQAVQTLRKEKQEQHKELSELKRISARESEEWVQFQKDLQYAVVIANDYRTEALTEVQQLQKEKDELVGKIKSLNAEVERLRKLERKNTAPNLSPIHLKPTSTESEIRQRMHAYIKSDSDIVGAATRKSNSTNTQLSVKSLIKSIETAAAEDSPKIPQSPTSVSPVNTTFSRPLLGRRNTTTASTKPFESKPAFTRRNTTTSMISTDTKSSHAARTCDDLKLTKEPLRPLLTQDTSVRSPTSRSPGATRSDARQTIGDALFRNTDFRSRKSSSPTTSTARDSQDAAASKTSGSPGNARRISDSEKKDPLSVLVKCGGGGSKRNALLKWCQAKTAGFKNIDITNFSSSWNDGLGFCAILYSYMPDKIPMHELNSQDKRRNFKLAFQVAEKLGIPSILDIEDMVKMERPDWQSVMTYVTSLYKHFET